MDDITPLGGIVGHMTTSFVLGPGMSLKKNQKQGFGIFQQDYFSNWLIIDCNYEFKPQRRKKKKTIEFLEPTNAEPKVEIRRREDVDFSPAAPVIKHTAPRSIEDPEVRKRLQVLRELYNSGAISRSTYERKKEELLSPH